MKLMFFIRNVREIYLIIFIKTMANEYFQGGSALIHSLIYSCLMLSYLFGGVFQATAFLLPINDYVPT